MAADQAVKVWEHSTQAGPSCQVCGGPGAGALGAGGAARCVCGGVLRLAGPSALRSRGSQSPQMRGSGSPGMSQAECHPRCTLATRSRYGLCPSPLTSGRSSVQGTPSSSGISWFLLSARPREGKFCPHTSLTFCGQASCDMTLLTPALISLVSQVHLGSPWLLRLVSGFTRSHPRGHSDPGAVPLGGLVPHRPSLGPHRQLLLSSGPGAAQLESAMPEVGGDPLQQVPTPAQVSRSWLGLLTSSEGEDGEPVGFEQGMGLSSALTFSTPTPRHLLRFKRGCPAEPWPTGAIPGP